MRMRTSLGRWLTAFLFPVALLCAVPTARTQGIVPEEASVIARIDVATSRIEDFGSDLRIELALSKAIPWRVFTLDDPMRLIVDFGEVDFDGANLAGLIRSDQVEGITYGRYREGWSRLVLVLAAPMRIETAGVSAGRGGIGSASLKMSLAPTTEREFLSSTGAPESGIFRLPSEDPVGKTGADGGSVPLKVVIDAGSGLDATWGWDDPLLGIARDLALGLVHDGHKVTLTADMPEAFSSVDLGDLSEDDDADVVLSLKVDPETSEPETIETATGGIVMTADATEAAPSEVAPRGERLAAHLVNILARHTGDLLQAPRFRAAFSVWPAHEERGVRVELGFVGSEAERTDFKDPAWRIRAVAGLREAFGSWASEETGAYEGR